MSKEDELRGAGLPRTEIRRIVAALPYLGFHRFLAHRAIAGSVRLSGSGSGRFVR